MQVRLRREDHQRNYMMRREDGEMEQYHQEPPKLHMRKISHTSVADLVRPLRNWLFAPELQWQPRGKRRI